MDLDGGLIFAVAQDVSAFDDAVTMGVSIELLAGPGREAWKFLAQYRAEHGNVPGVKLLEEKFGSPFGRVEADLSYLVKELHRRSMFNDLKVALEHAANRLEHRNPEGALEVVEKVVEQVRGKQFQDVRVYNVLDLGEQVIEMYMRTKRGEVGIPLPWPSMNEMTMGLWPGTLTFLAARPGQGKTFAVVIILRHAWLKGSRVLLVSPEMSKLEIAERFFSIQGRMPYREVVSGSLGAMAEPRFFDGIRSLQGSEGYYIIDDPDKMTPVAIEAAIDSARPDVVGVDSAYMIRSCQGNRYDRMVATVDWLRELAKRKKVPVIALSQFNRAGGDRKTGGSMDDMAMTDTIAWDAHNLFGMHQDDDMKADRVMEFKSLKVRRQAFQKDVKVHWDFDVMNFEEIGSERAEDFKDVGFDDTPF